MDPFFLATSRFNRQKYDACIELCDLLLQKNANDQAAWMLKCRALTKKMFIDDLEIEDEGVADMLMDDNAMQNAPRPGTSFTRPMSSASGGISQNIRPMSNAGRAMTGYMRPGTNRALTGQSRGNLTTALKQQRQGTSRAITSGGRLVRLGTATLMQSNGDQFIDPTKIIAKDIIKKRHIAKAVVDYLIYVESNFRRALDIASEGIYVTNYEDWWWKARVGKCQFKMGMVKEAESQFISSIKKQSMISTTIELIKVSVKQDQPVKAIELFQQGLKSHQYDPSLQIGIARIHDMLNDSRKSFQLYKQVLVFDNNSVESIASIAAYHFYTDQPEVALRFYKRLAQCGIQTSELWNNMGLCCFYASQFDMALGCFDRALGVADSDEVRAEVWYNIGHIGVGIGDLGLAYQSFKISVSHNANHAESFNNLGVLELRKGNVDQARSNFQQATKASAFLFEPQYNIAYLFYKKGEFQQSYSNVKEALQLFPDHQDSKELLKNLQKHFTVL